ncbi:putative metal-binding motif-containing protein [Sanyastnella coralliicola]|uniref:putative metal-binding motif-containing protein n=1 Tax=Sanyastnella coralliicola TaxID=3069118 RepID=UPI0027BA52E0|nr:putative metal-binding motif-containing protein [Longitalea sp. SCSIO 12813]
MKSLTNLLLTVFVLAPSILMAQGNCTEEDLSYIANNIEFVTQVSADCGTDCLFAGDPEACFSDCMSALVPLTGPCVGCFSGQTACATDNCFLQCVFGSQEDCAACIEENCLDSFNECAGIYDNDNDTFTTLSDCDDGDASINPGATEIWYDGIDQNCDGADDFDQDGDGDPSAEYGGTDCNDLDPNTNNDVVTWFADTDMDGFGDVTNSTTSCMQPPGFILNNNDCDDTRNDVYPGAPGTGAGIDNNCNGVIDPDEVLICLGDLDNDLTVGTNDLLIFLSGFGCLENCITDLDGDGTVVSSDLLLFLSAFGIICD